MKLTTIITVILLSLFTFGLALKITFITFAEIFISCLIVYYFFKPIKIEKVSILIFAFFIASLISYFPNYNSINTNDFMLSSLRMLFWTIFMVVVYPHVKKDIQANNKQFYQIIMNMTMIVCIVAVIQYIAFQLGIGQFIIDLKFLSPITRGYETRMLTEVAGIQKIRPASIFVEPSFFALFCAVNITYILYNVESVKDLNKCLFFIISMVLSNSFFGVVMAAGFIGIIFIKYPKTHKTIILLLILLVGIIYYFPVDYVVARVSGNLYTRSSIFRVITPFTHIKEALIYSPLFGLGWDNTLALAHFGVLPFESYISTGNDIAFIITSTGIVGTSLFLLVYHYLLKDKKNKIILIIIIIAVLLSTGDFLIPFFWYHILMVAVIPKDRSILGKVCGSGVCRRRDGIA